MLSYKYFCHCLYQGPVEGRVSNVIHYLKQRDRPLHRNGPRFLILIFTVIFMLSSTKAKSSSRPPVPLPPTSPPHNYEYVVYPALTDNMPTASSIGEFSRCNTAQCNNSEYAAAFCATMRDGSPCSFSCPLKQSS